MGRKQQCKKDENCDSVVLGDLIKKLKAQELFPVPEVDSVTTCIDDLFSQLRETEFTSLCQIKNPTPRRQHFKDRRTYRDCVLNHTLKAEMSNLKRKTSGLILTEFDGAHGTSLDDAHSTSFNQARTLKPLEF